MKRGILPLTVITAIALAGCSSTPSDVDTTVKSGSGVVQNPGGQPQNPQQAAYAADMQKTGNAMNAEMQKEAAEMQAAKARAGAK